MKKILFALAAFIGISYTADAQESPYAKNYKICRSDTGYQVCPDQSTTNLNDPAPQYIRRNNPPPWQQNSFVSPVNIGRTTETQQIPTRKALENSYPVKNEEMEQNNKRNLNTGNNIPLSPSTGDIR